MTAFLAILRRHPVARAGAAWLFLFGFAGAATSPYLPVDRHPRARHDRRRLLRS